ncbi:hypothetical protein RYZ26_14285 [Terasakiella sp. A23]|uniref:hypothetical protein n=1 Tax=Terasakiella sp. FCG-A23 TaxID=3080561 RepID=UPI002952DA3C|nr:hypothetical protein [Terasakiella sp. A23]MDV7340770.1 hypothetical protein [Terasakiella sp. A23]
MITQIISATDAFIVYIDEDDELRYVADGLPKSQKRNDIFNTYSKCRFAINTRFNGAKNIQLKYFLGRAYSAALDDLLLSNEAPKGMQYMQNAENFIQSQKTEEEAITYFTSISIGLTLFSTLVFSALHFNVTGLHQVENVFLAIVFGIVGAMTSIIHRSRTIQPEKFSKARYHWLQATIFLSFGAISGLLLFLAAKGNLILGAFATERDALMVFCFIAGFSERFFDSLVAKLETKISS